MISLGQKSVFSVCEPEPASVIISIFISGGINATLTKHMFSALRDFIDPTIAAISTIMVLISTTLLLATQFLGSKSTK